jgi:hypothetical protein
MHDVVQGVTRHASESSSAVELSMESEQGGVWVGSRGNGVWKGTKGVSEWGGKKRSIVDRNELNEWRNRSVGGGTRGTSKHKHRK